MEYINVCNFGPISELEITLKKVNVFIGEQGVGKSTLAKLLSCCRDMFLYFLILQDCDTDAIMDIFRTYGIQDYFKENTFIAYTNSKEQLNLTYKSDKFEVSHNTLTNEQLKQIFPKMLANSVANASNTLGTTIGETGKVDIAKLIKENGPLVISNLRTSLYCPAERSTASMLSNSLASIMLSNIPLPKTLIEYMSFFEKARQEYSSFKIPFLNLLYTFDKGVDFVTVNDSSVQLKYASSGIQSILPLLMVTEYCLQHKFFSSFTIEEPELNLFPTNQYHLLQTLIAKTNDSSTNLGSWTITTHSPYLLSVFNISLLAGCIRKKYPESMSGVSNLINPAYIIQPDEIAVYELSFNNSNNTSSCRSILDEKTGLIKNNYLDSVSDIISNDFNQLYKLFIKLSRESK